MATVYNINRWLNGVNGFGLAFSDTNYSAALAANTDTTIAVPTISAPGFMNANAAPAYLALFSYQADTNFWVAINVAATVPAGATFAATASQLNPTARVVSAGDVIHVLTPTASAVVSIQFYFIQER